MIFVSRLRCCMLLVAVMASFGAAAHCEPSTTSKSGPGLTLQGQPEPSGAPIRDALGRPCLDVEAAARPQVVNPKMLDHVVSIVNKCPRLIRTKVCYFNSDRCKELDLQPYKRIDTVLGTMSGIGFFRYTIVQR